MGKLVYILLKVLVKLTAIIPFSVFYAFADLIYIILFHLLKYRRDIVQANLKASFPEKNKNELKDIERKFYKHLADMFVESFKAFSMKKEQIIERHFLDSIESFKAYDKNKRSVLVVTGHYGNWEWGALSAPLQADFTFVAINKRIKNPHIDKFIHENRSRYGTVLAQIKETSATFKQYHDKHAAFILVADQSPGTLHLKDAYWLKFLNQDTACLHGPEKYAKKYNLPVLYLEIKKVKRGYYKINVEELVADPKKLADGEITKRYMQRLEKTILEAPEYWLWSHRRWKRKREAVS